MLSFYQKHMRTLALIAVFTLLTVLIAVINFGVLHNKAENRQGISYAIAFTENVTHRNIQTDADGVKALSTGTETVREHILTGLYAGNTVQASAILTTEMQIAPHVGQFVVVSIDMDSHGIATVLVDDAFRLPFWVGAVLLVSLLLCVIGQRKGKRSLAALVFNLACVFGIFVPLVFRGDDPLLWAMIIQIAVAGVTFGLMDGWTVKSLTAFLGTMGGTIVACFLAILCGKCTALNGFALNNADSLVVIAQSTQMKVHHLLLAGVLLSSFGAVMDIAMSVTAAVGELHAHNSDLPAKGLFLAGMRVGHDMMGTMANTLLLAFAGASITTLLMLYSYLVPIGQAANGRILEFSPTINQVPLWVLLNNNLVGTELMEGITGTAAIILTVPLVAGISAKLLPLWMRMHPFQTKEEQSINSK
ncbi:MAG: YibE/F family protein [Ethanoligenens sp.]